MTAQPGNPFDTFLPVTATASDTRGTAPSPSQAEGEGARLISADDWVALLSGFFRAPVGSESRSHMYPEPGLGRHASFRYPPQPVREQPRVRPLVAMGVDVARFGADRTAICVREDERVIFIASYWGDDTMATAGRVVNAIRTYQPAAVFIDETGIGAGVVDRLRELQKSDAAPHRVVLPGPRAAGPAITGVNAAARPSDREQYANLRAELYDALRWRFENHRIKVPNDPELISQLSTVRYGFTGSGQILIESKDSLRARGQPSPDKADALALAFAARTRQPVAIWV